MNTNDKGFLDIELNEIKPNKMANILGVVLGAASIMASPTASTTSRLITGVAAVAAVKKTYEKKEDLSTGIVTSFGSGLISMSILGGLANSLFGKK